MLSIAVFVISIVSSMAGRADEIRVVPLPASVFDCAFDMDSGTLAFVDKEKNELFVCGRDYLDGSGWLMPRRSSWSSSSSLRIS
jgi:hypothetical protein